MSTITVNDIATGTTWVQLRDRMFETLDSDAGGVITKEEIEYSPLANQLMQHWAELTKKKKKKRVSKKDWTKWFETIKENVLGGDEDAMQKFCAKIVYEADIDVSDLLPPSKSTVESKKKSVITSANEEADASASNGITRAVFSMIGKAYLEAKNKIDDKIPETAASRLSQIEKAIDSRYESVADAIDETVESIKTSARKRIGSIADSTTKRVDGIVQQPLVKNLVTPVTCAVVDGLLEAGDVIVDYALPEESAPTQDASKTADDSKVEGESAVVIPHAKKLASKLHARLCKRAESGITIIEERKRQLEKVQVDLIAYAKGFLGQQKMLLKRATEDPKKLSAEKLKNLQEFAQAVVEPYRVKLKGQWQGTVQPVFLAVTDYGEYFMENVREYEKSSKIDGEDAPVPSNDNDVNRFISRVAHRFIEPGLVRTVAVFMVLGDEMRRLKVQSIEPNVVSAKKKVKKRMSDAVEGAQRVMSKVMTHVNGRYASGLKRLDGQLVKFEEFKERLAVQVRTEFDAIVQPVQAKIFAAIQSLPWSGKKPVTLQDLRAKVMQVVGEEHEKYIAPLIQKIHLAIVLAEEWATPWVDAAKKTMSGDDKKEDGY